MIKRAYLRLWESLVWVRQRGSFDQWEKCTFAELGVTPVKESGKKSPKGRKIEESVRVKKVPQGPGEDHQWL